MEHQADIWIRRAEGVWLEPLERYTESLFSGIFLPSHDHTHHRRVWNISRKLIMEVSCHHPYVDYPFVEGALIAAWFHDTGMVRSTGEKHGDTGRTLCRDYFRDHDLAPPELFGEVLEAISRHDTKDDLIYTGIGKAQRPEILSILSVADDLEALGIIGIYRYSEIYLHRGIGLTDLGDRVLENANRRFRHLTGCQLCKDLIRDYEKEWKELVSFFEKYNRQLREKEDPEPVSSGPLGVVNLIRSLGLKGHVRPEAMAEAIPAANADPYISRYFSRLHDELEQARL